MKDKKFKQMKHYEPQGFQKKDDFPNYNPDACYVKDGTYLVYESESSSNKKAHVGAFLEACCAVKNAGATEMYMFFVQKESKKNKQVLVSQFPSYFRPYVQFMKSCMTGVNVRLFFISDENFVKLSKKEKNILDMLDDFSECNV